MQGVNTAEAVTGSVHNPREELELRIAVTAYLNTLRTGDVDLRIYITSVQDG